MVHLPHHREPVECAHGAGIRVSQGAGQRSVRQGGVPGRHQTVHKGAGYRVDNPLCLARGRVPSLE